MPDRKRGPDRPAVVGRGRRHIHTFKRCPHRNLPISDAVQRAAPRETQGLLMSAVIEIVRDMEEGFLVHRLEGSSDVVMSGEHRFPSLSRWAKRLDKFLPEVLSYQGSVAITAKA